MRLKLATVSIFAIASFALAQTPTGSGAAPSRRPLQAADLHGTHPPAEGHGRRHAERANGRA